MTTRTKLTALIGALAIGAAGCGGDDEASSGSSGEGEAAAPSTLALELTGKGKNVKLTGPESVAAGVVEITLKSDAPGEHSAQLVRIDGEQTAEEVDAAGDAWGDKGKALPEWLRLVGGVTAETGQTVSATQVLEPGRYLALDIGSDTDPSPTAEFEVTEGEDGGELPETEATVEMKEYSFTGDGLKAGKQQVLLDNTGSQPHFIVGAPLAKGATVDEAKKFFESEGEGAEGPPPADFENAFSTSVLDGGTKQVVDLDLKAGKYVFVCFIPDRAGGPPHVAKGMVSEVAVG